MPVGKAFISGLLVPDTFNTISVTRYLNGRLVGRLEAGPPIPVDSDYDLTITDPDGVVVYNEATITDNSRSFLDIASSLNVYLDDIYTITISFTTALSGDTALFDLMLFLLTP